MKLWLPLFRAVPCMGKNREAGADDFHDLGALVFLSLSDSLILGVVGNCACLYPTEYIKVMGYVWLCDYGYLNAGLHYTK